MDCNQPSSIGTETRTAAAAMSSPNPNSSPILSLFLKGFLWFISALTFSTIAAIISTTFFIILDIFLYPYEFNPLKFNLIYGKIFQIVFFGSLLIYVLCDGMKLFVDWVTRTYLSVTSAGGVEVGSDGLGQEPTTAATVEVQSQANGSGGIEIASIHSGEGRIVHPSSSRFEYNCVIDFGSGPHGNCNGNRRGSLSLSSLPLLSESESKVKSIAARFQNNNALLPSVSSFLLPKRVSKSVTRPGQSTPSSSSLAVNEISRRSSFPNIHYVQSRIRLFNNGAKSLREISFGSSDKLESATKEERFENITVRKLVDQFTPATATATRPTTTDGKCSTKEGQSTRQCQLEAHGRQEFANGSAAAAKVISPTDPDYSSLGWKPTVVNSDR